MSAIYIVATIIVLVGALICYMFIAQTLEKKRKQQQRILQALGQRAKVFRYILSGFPPNFLTKELTLLVQRCLTDVLQQLARMQPKDKTYVQELADVGALMDATHKRSDNTKRASLQSPKQVADVKLHLQELHKFLMNLQRRGAIKNTEAHNFGNQLKELMLEISVESYLLQAKQAKQNDKPKLAIHYFELAQKLLERDNDGRYTTKLNKINAVIDQLRTVIATPTTSADSAGEPLKDKGWSEVDEKDSWKKKNIYD